MEKPSDDKEKIIEDRENDTAIVGKTIEVMEKSANEDNKEASIALGQLLTTSLSALNSSKVS